ncbi:UvrD-helicase domain-containing protein [Pseudomonas pharyngis]|uniref:UvrD-helicase domain-containing protein n=1 Tax=Pseudomonas pharyngis TaxID=2892333 RepID=UPI003FD22084
MDIGMTPFQNIISCLERGESFVLQGGAGSGKTETLKELLDYISKNMPEKRVACITHTNLAANEIKARAGELHAISTIHSFLNGIINSFRIDMHKVIHELFLLPEFRVGQAMDDEKEYKKREHERYKKAYGKYADKAYLILKIKEAKVLGKPMYDKDPQAANTVLNEKINHLNAIVLEHIKKASPQKVCYNETAFDSFRDLSFGHDGLVRLAVSLMCERKKLRKILADRYDYIFVDEYQDTSPGIVKAFLDYVLKDQNIVFGFFGDSMQGIYEDGVGDVESYVRSGAIEKINKEDNYRCSEQVVRLINNLRDDGLEQSVAFRTRENGDLETLADRQGRVKLVYAICDDKPAQHSPREEKDSYLKKLNELIETARGIDSYKILMLTNKAVASEAGFSQLYEIFNSRFGQATNENLEKVLAICHFSELYDLHEDYVNKRYAKVIHSIKKSGFVLDSVFHKDELLIAFKSVFDLSSPAHDAINKSFKLKLLKQSDSYERFVRRREEFFEVAMENSRYSDFKDHYFSGFDSLSKLNKAGFDIDEYEFGDLERDVKRELFYNVFFGAEITLGEVFKYYDYLSEKTNFITMHKTKGSGIENVLVVADEFFWRDYKFANIFSAGDITPENRKIMYVACSRAIKNLTCVRIMSTEESSTISDYFNEAECVSLS